MRARQSLLPHYYRGRVLAVARNGDPIACTPVDGMVFSDRVLLRRCSPKDRNAGCSFFKHTAMTTNPQNFDEALSLRDRIIHVLSIMHKGSAKEVAAEVIELQGIASEEGVEEITIDIENELEKMLEEALVVEVREHRQKKRYSLASSAG